MDRVIKFRGKEFSKKSWFFASAYDQENEIFIIDFADVVVIDETVGQFTGFKDIDDKEIFEGDIIQNVDSDDEEIYSIVMIADCWCGLISGGSPDNDEDAQPLGWLLDNAAFKVIGNIYDNPKLCKICEVARLGADK